MISSTRAIVLHALKYGDSQLIVDLLSENRGRLSFIMRIPKTQKAKVRKQIFQPLSVVEISYDHRPTAKLQHLRDARLAYPPASIPFNPDKLAIALFIAEFLSYATRDEQENTPLFQYVENSIRWLDNAETSFANFHLVFTMRLAKFIGFLPNLDNYEEGFYFDLLNGCFTPEAPAHSNFIPPAEASHIGKLMRMNYESMHLFRMSRSERNQCIDQIITFYRLHVPGFKEMKSLSVLRELGN